MRRAGNRDQETGIANPVRWFSPFLRLIAQGRSWVRAIVHRHELEAEMEAELASHLESLTADLIRAGYTAEEAARRARIEMGPVLVHKEGMRASLGLRLLDELAADLRYGIRLLAKTPGFTAVITLSLALAIGANTSMFSVAKDLLYNRLSIPRPTELRMFRWVGDSRQAAFSGWGDFDPVPGGGTTGTIFSYPAYKALRDHNTVMQDLAAYKEEAMNATVRGTAQRVTVALVSGNYYNVLEVRPQIGRVIEASDDRTAGSGTVALISDSLWSRAFGRSPSVIGQTLTLNQSVMTIIGVNPPRFTGAKNVLVSPDLFVPLSIEPLLVAERSRVPYLANPNFWWLNIVGRLKAGVPESQARAAIAVQFEAAVRSTGEIKQGETIPRFELEDGSRGLHWADRIFRKPVYVLWSLTGFVLLLACANVANLLLSRGAQRQREMSIRLALGAGRKRVLRQLMTESLLLAAIAGVGGLLLGYFTRNLLPHLFTNGWETPGLDVPFDWGVFLFASGVTLTAGVLFGLAPAWLAARTEVSSNLKESAQTATRRRKGLSGKSIVAFQIMLSTLLVVGAGLFLRTVAALNSIDPGFETKNLVLFDISPPAARYPAGKDVQLHEELEKRIGALPGVEKVTVASEAYLANNGISNSNFVSEDEGLNDKKAPVDINIVGRDFFSTLKIPVVAGRGFGAQDTSSSTKVAVINEALARKRFNNVNPIGKRFRMDRDAKAPLIQIVGICANTRYDSLKGEPPPQFFVPFFQQPEVGGMTYELRTKLGTADLAPEVRQVVQGVDRDLPVIEMRTQEEQTASSMQVERTLALLVAGFGALALALAAVGIYGVMSYQVAQRRNEIGIRLALGAQPGQVREMILRESTWIAAAGIAVGLGTALALARLIKSMLYGVSPNDPLTLGAGVVMLLGVALGSSWLPARRAASVQPSEALRHE